MSKEILIRNATIFDSTSDFDRKQADIYIANGIIEKVSDSIQVATDTVIELENLCVSQGWVDIFADYCEPGYEHKETILAGLNTAAQGGFTDVFLLPNTLPAVSTKSVVEFVSKQGRGNIVNLHPIGAVTQNIEGKELAEMTDMFVNGAIAFSDGWNPLQNTGIALKALELIKAFNGILLQMPIDYSIAKGGLMHEGINAIKMGMAGIPALAETILLHRDIELLRYTGSKLHVTGISCARSVDMIRAAKAEGLSISCSVTPYHLALTDSDLHGYDSQYKVFPPLREEADRVALILGLKDGVIDCIATHHHPQDWDAKNKEFEYASDGLAIQENAFNIIWHSLSNLLNMERIIETLTTVPRDIFGLPQYSLMPGNQACLTLFSKDARQNITRVTGGHTMVFNNPFREKLLSGQVFGIINNNQIYIK